ncbi:hypothetical protein [Corallococcus sp. AB011P]|uniref:hypothetical protein n=1 Tax=Corallococcus sp. AB011P TaxID=2316735 RepID=UPI0011C42EA8|nr:hypothetical protein [Corallococcus sp. AB011P]
MPKNKPENHPGSSSPMPQPKTAPPAQPPLNLSLLQNGIDFVQAAVILLYSDSKLPLLAHKYAVLHVFSGALLLLKERLSWEHPSLIWAEVTHVDNAEKITVDFDTCLDRLRSIAKVNLDESQMKLLRRAQKHRNRIEHYAIDLKLEEAEKLVAEMVEFIFVFMRDELEENLEDDLPEDAWNKIQKLRQVAQRLQQEREALEVERISSAEKRYQASINGLDSKDLKWWQRAYRYMVMPSSELEALVEEPFWDPHTPSPAPPRECADCGSESVVVMGDGIAICTNPDCRSPHSVHLCIRCGGDDIIGGNDDDLCESCQNEFAAFMEKD